MEKKYHRKIILTKTKNNDKQFEDFLHIETTMNPHVSTSFILLPSGCPIIDESHKIKHIFEPELKLPTLKDRASRSNMKDLYNISKRLMPSNNEKTGSTSKNEKNKTLKGNKTNEDIIINKNTLEMQEEVMALVKKPKNYPNYRSPEDLENAKEHDGKSVRSDTSSIAAMKNFKLLTETEHLTAKRNLKVQKRKSPEQSIYWGLYKKFHFDKKTIHKSTQTILDSQDESNMVKKFYKLICNCLKYDKWLLLSLILLLCTTAYIFYITRFDICHWHTKKIYYDSLKADSNFIMKFYYCFRIWLIKP